VQDVQLGLLEREIPVGRGPVAVLVRGEVGVGDDHTEPAQLRGQHSLPPGVDRELGSKGQTAPIGRRTPEGPEGDGADGPAGERHQSAGRLPGQAATPGEVRERRQVGADHGQLPPAPDLLQVEHVGVGLVEARAELGGPLRERGQRRGQAAHVEGRHPQRAGATGHGTYGRTRYFLLAPGEESRWHTVRSDELWLWHAGGPLTLYLGGDGDQPAEPVEEIRLGPDVAGGQRPQALVPGRVWPSAKPRGAEPTLVSCIVAPGFDYADFQLL
jgi:uncharacterized protein